MQYCHLTDCVCFSQLQRACELPQSGSGCTDLHGEIKVPLHRNQGCFLDDSYTSKAEAKYIQKEKFTLSTGKLNAKSLSMGIQALYIYI